MCDWEKAMLALRSSAFSGNHNCYLPTSTEVDHDISLPNQHTPLEKPKSRLKRRSITVWQLICLELLYLIWNKDEGRILRGEDTQLQELITNLSNPAIWWPYFNCGWEAGWGSKLAKEHRGNLIKYFRHLIQNLKTWQSFRMVCQIIMFLQPNHFLSFLLHCWIFTPHPPSKKNTTHQAWHWIHGYAQLKGELIKQESV